MNKVDNPIRSALLIVRSFALCAVATSATGSCGEAYAAPVDNPMRRSQSELRVLLNAPAVMHAMGDQQPLQLIRRIRATDFESVYEISNGVCVAEFGVEWRQTKPASGAPHFPFIGQTIKRSAGCR